MNPLDLDLAWLQTCIIAMDLFGDHRLSLILIIDAGPNPDLLTHVPLDLPHHHGLA